MSNTDNRELTCQACLSDTGRNPVWKDDLEYTGHSQMPMDEDLSHLGHLGTCCCEKRSEPMPSCNRCLNSPKGISFDLRQLLQTKSFMSNINKYKEKVKEKGGFCCVI